MYKAQFENLVHDPYDSSTSNQQNVMDILRSIHVVNEDGLVSPMDDVAYEFFTHLIQDDILFPVSFLVFRMYVTLQGGSSIFMKKGSDTGVLTIKDPAIMYDRVSTEFKLNVQARFTAGTVVHNSQNLTVMPHTTCTSLTGGAGTRIFNPCSDHHMSSYEEGDCTIADLFVMAVPYGFECPDYWTDITGTMNKLMYVGDPSDNNENNSLMYPTAGIYKNHWNWDHPIDHHPLEYRSDEVYDVRDETLALQSYQKNFNANTNKFDIEIEGKTALGPIVRPDTFKVLQGIGDEYSGRGVEGSTMLSRN
jgi:hypothetical protein